MWSTDRDLLWNSMGASAAGIVIAAIGSTNPRPTPAERREPVVDMST